MYGGQQASQNQSASNLWILKMALLILFVGCVFCFLDMANFADSHSPKPVDVPFGQGLRYCSAVNMLARLISKD